MDAGVEARISGRLRDALLADLMRDEEDGGYWLTVRLDEPTDWTHHLGRQLEIDTNQPGDIHATLLVLIPELDNLLRRWPLQPDIAWCTALAHEATKNLDALEVYATLLAGPASWKREKIHDCSVGKLRGHLQQALERGVATQLHAILSDWAKWDIRTLADRRREALHAERQMRETGRANGAGPRVRVPLMERSNPLGYFQPPGRA